MKKKVFSRFNFDMPPSYNFAYYCSGHGYGHATRVTAVAESLISQNHQVTIVSSARESVFASVLSHPSGRCRYRSAVLEPTVVQPKAYDVDQLETFKNLEHFLTFERENLIAQERQWLIDGLVNCALIDAPFLPCAAASEANIPAVIISNFTFDSCYSYLSAFNSEQVGVKVDPEKLNDLVAITVRDYSCAELLLRLPGSIPIPGFDSHIKLPATEWVQDDTHSFTAEIEAKLNLKPKENAPRKVVDMPLIVRPLSQGVYNPATKLALLKSLGVPIELLDTQTKILLVSFGGQIIPRPKSIVTNGTHLDQTGSNGGMENILPPGWVAIVCGLSSATHDAERPDRFYSIPDSVFHYVPDLTAIADVVLGKLGYGTCSEVLATRTPFISVPRKMFVEEYGLKRLMSQASITQLEMSIKEFEAGRWASYILRADRSGHLDKLQHSQRQAQEDKEQKQDGVEIIVDHLERFLLAKNQSLVPPDCSTNLTSPQRACYYPL